MLEEISIRNLGLIQSLDITFQKQFNTITGETGVGKSMLLGAIGLLLGDRASSDFIRKGEKQASVNGVFKLSPDLIQQWQQDWSDVIDDNTIHIRRTISREGRSKAYFGGVPINLSQLKEMTSRMVTIHGQQEHQTLLKKEKQINLLDRFAGPHNIKECTTFRKKLIELREKQKLLDHFSLGEKQRQEEIEYLDFQLKEARLIDAGPKELVNLEQKIKKISNSQRITEVLKSSIYLLEDSDHSVLASVKKIQKDLSSLSLLDSDFNQIFNELEKMLPFLEDVSFQLQNKLTEFEYSEGSVDDLIQRAEVLKKLFQKHRIEEEEAPDYFESLSRKFEELQTESRNPEQLKAEINDLSADLLSSGLQLHETRKKAARLLETRVEAELQDLGMPDAEFSVSLKLTTEQPEDITQKATLLGIDQIEFMFMPNPGESMRPMREIASGGELARSMLAVSKVLGQADHVGVLIFDEIDSNIGGRLGTIVGKKLASLSLNHQVICVTHLPQIASFADQQYKIFKEVNSGRTVTKIIELQKENRIDEIAEMIQGQEKNQITYQQAEEMLNLGKQHSQHLLSQSPASV